MSHTADINRLQLFYRDDGSGAPLLLLHGFMGTSDDWRHVFAAPLDGYRVITPDLRGHGRSTNPSGIFRFADVARDIYALLDHLDINRVKAIGMSAGANTLLHMATQSTVPRTVLRWTLSARRWSRARRRTDATNVTTGHAILPNTA